MVSFNPSTWPLLRRLSKEQRIIAVICIALAFFITEIAIGFRNRSLALIADAFHIFSDLIGYVVALIATRMGRVDKSTPMKYSFGYQRASLIGGFFNGAFLMALGVSVLLQSIERFLEPSEILGPLLVLAIGAAGVGSNILMILVMGGHDHGGHGHSHGARDNDELAQTPFEDHAEHAHSKPKDGAKGSGRDLNVLGIFIHILGDALNSIAVIISAGVFIATGFIYADPIASVFVGFMIIGTSYPLVVRSGRYLLESAPEGVDIKGVTEDVERITGPDTVHELHVWNLTQSKVLVTMHIAVDGMSVSDFVDLSVKVRQCLHYWNIHISTIQPELRAALPAFNANTPDLVETAATDVALVSGNQVTPNGLALTQLSHRVACKLACRSGCGEEVCCVRRV